MSDIALEAARLLDILPEQDKKLAYELIKKLILAWDPDFTKVTPDEAEKIKHAEASGFLDENEIDWNNLENI